MFFISWVIYDLRKVYPSTICCGKGLGGSSSTVDHDPSEADTTKDKSCLYLMAKTSCPSLRW